MPITHECEPPEPGNKRVEVTLVIHTYEDVPEDWDEEHIRFYIEENHCHGNYLTQIQEDEEKAGERAGVRDPSGVCQLCAFSEAYVGHLPFKNILGHQPRWIDGRRCRTCGLSLTDGSCPHVSRLAGTL